MAIRRNGRRQQTPREMNGELAPTNFGQPGVSFPQISTILSNSALPQALSLRQLEPRRLNSAT